MAALTSPPPPRSRGRGTKGERAVNTRTSAWLAEPQGTFKPLLAPVVNQWCNEDQIFDDPRDIFRMTIGKQKLYGEKFQFK